MSKHFPFEDKSLGLLYDIPPQPKTEQKIIDGDQKLIF